MHEIATKRLHASTSLRRTGVQRCNDFDVPSVLSRIALVIYLVGTNKNNNSYLIPRMRDSTESSKIIACRAVAHRFKPMKRDTEFQECATAWKVLKILLAVLSRIAFV